MLFLLHFFAFERKIIRYLNTGEDTEKTVEPIYCFLDAVLDNEYLDTILSATKKN